jgi:hypothetical protein
LAERWSGQTVSEYTSTKTRVENRIAVIRKAVAVLLLWREVE